MKKADRQIVHDKYGGRCAYCGDPLVKGWHVDHIQALDRFAKTPNTERNCIENYNPACASCNINKHSGSLEDFRQRIAGFMKHLNEVSTQYKIAKRYGLVQETVKPVVFYSETFNNQQK
jgi:5-methylcytosine-specific restriction endonuclease McrA